MSNGRSIGSSANVASSSADWREGWRPARSNIERSARADSKKYSLVPGIFVLYIYLVVPYFFVSDDQIGVIYSREFSVRNIIEMLCTAFLAINVAYIILKNKYAIADALRDRGSIVGTLLGLYILSTAWSLNPQFTLFRATQAALLFVYVSTLLRRNSHDASTALRSSMLFVHHLCIIGLIIYSLPRIAAGGGFDGLYFGFLKNNAFGGAAGLLTLISLAGIANRTKGSKLALVNSLVFQFAAGTLTSTLGTALGVAWLLTSHVTLRFFRVFTWVGVAIGYIVVLGANVPLIGDTLIPMLAEVFGRTTESIMSMTGRRYMWNISLEMMAGRPFGAGFAMDQEILLPLYKTGLIGIVGSAHNLFLEANIALGWIGPPLIVAVFVQWWMSARRLAPSARNLLQAVVIYCVFCAPSISGIAGTNVNSLFAIGSLVALAPFWTISPRHLPVTGTSQSPTRQKLSWFIRR